MAFANRPKVIVLDEPTTALDVTTQAHVLDTVRDLTRSYGVAALYVTHDLAVVSNLADRIAVMYAGRLVEIGPSDELFAAGLPPVHAQAACRPSRTSPGSAPCAASPAGRRAPASGRRLRLHAALRLRGRQVHPASSRRSKASAPATRCAAGDRREFGARAAESDIVLRDKSLSARDTAVKEVISVRDVKAFYQRKETLHGINATLSERRCLALVGESGSARRPWPAASPACTSTRSSATSSSWASRWPATSRDAAARPRGRPSSTSSRAPTARSTRARRSARSSRSRFGSSSTCTRDETEDRMVERARAGGAGLVAAQPLPRPALRRRAPAHGHRARPGRRAHGAHLRRGHLVARRLRAGRHHRASRRPAARHRT